MLTRKQHDLLHFIHKRLQSDGVPPSFDEMKDALDLRSKSGIHRLIIALEERGFIRRLAHRARAIEIVKLPEPLASKRSAAGAFSADTRARREASVPLPGGAMPVAVRVMELPVMGRIAAGVPIEAISQISHTIAVPDQMVGKGHHYALEVKGDSMIEAGINDGDVVVIREQSTAEDGDIVVALVVDSNEATLKRFRRRGRMIVLEAANPAYEPRVLPDDQVRVQGRLVGLIRSY